jgi:GT2 family glycosyltransferase
MPKISVIIPSLNSQIIDQTLASLRRQTLGLNDVEILVVGRDELGRVQADDVVQLIDTQEPVSPACARNLGLRAASGQYLFFTDADCVVSDDWLERMLIELAVPGNAVVGGGVQFPNRGYWSLCDDIAYFHEFLVQAPEGARTQLPTLNLGVRRAVVDEIGYFDERYPHPGGEDADWTMRMRAAGYRLVFVPSITVMHLHNRVSLDALVQHGRRFGYYSTKVDPRYWDELKTPFFLRSFVLFLFFTPFLAVGATLRILLKPYLWRYWYTAPGILLAKLCWCWGALRKLWAIRTGVK